MIGDGMTGYAVGCVLGSILGLCIGLLIARPAARRFFYWEGRYKGWIKEDHKSGLPSFTALRPPLRRRIAHRVIGIESPNGRLGT